MAISLLLLVFSAAENEKIKTCVKLLVKLSLVSEILDVSAYILVVKICPSATYLLKLG